MSLDTVKEYLGYAYQALGYTEKIFSTVYYVHHVIESIMHWQHDEAYEFQVSAQKRLKALVDLDSCLKDISNCLDHPRQLTEKAFNERLVHLEEICTDAHSDRAELYVIAKHVENFDRDYNQLIQSLNQLSYRLTRKLADYAGELAFPNLLEGLEKFIHSNGFGYRIKHLKNILKGPSIIPTLLITPDNIGSLSADLMRAMFERMHSDDMLKDILSILIKPAQEVTMWGYYPAAAYSLLVNNRLIRFLYHTNPKLNKAQPRHQTIQAFFKCLERLANSQVSAINKQLHVIETLPKHAYPTDFKATRTVHKNTGLMASSKMKTPDTLLCNVKKLYLQNRLLPYAVMEVLANYDDSFVADVDSSAIIDGGHSSIAAHTSGYEQ